MRSDPARPHGRETPAVPLLAPSGTSPARPDAHDEPLNLIVEVSGERKKDKAAKVATARTLWVPAVNNLRTLGRWAFAELTEIYEIDADFKARVDRDFDAILVRAGRAVAVSS